METHAAYHLKGDHGFFNMYDRYEGKGVSPGGQSHEFAYFAQWLFYSLRGNPEVTSLGEMSSDRRYQ
jgi:hypothetical protein